MQSTSVIESTLQGIRYLNYDDEEKEKSAKALESVRRNIDSSRYLVHENSSMSPDRVLIEKEKAHQRRIDLNLSRQRHQANILMLRDQSV